jgi:hypothetical protein
MKNIRTTMLKFDKIKFVAPLKALIYLNEDK